MDAGRSAAVLRVAGSRGNGRVLCCGGLPMRCRGHFRVRADWPEGLAEARLVGVVYGVAAGTEASKVAPALRERGVAFASRQVERDAVLIDVFSAEAGVLGLVVVRDVDKGLDELFDESRWWAASAWGRSPPSAAGGASARAPPGPRPAAASCSWALPPAATVHPPRRVAPAPMQRPLDVLGVAHGLLAPEKQPRCRRRGVSVISLKGSPARSTLPQANSGSPAGHAPAFQLGGREGSLGWPRGVRMDPLRPARSSGCGKPG